MTWTYTLLLSSLQPHALPLGDDRVNRGDVLGGTTKFRSSGYTNRTGLCPVNRPGKRDFQRRAQRGGSIGGTCENYMLWGAEQELIGTSSVALVWTQRRWKETCRGHIGVRDNQDTTGISLAFA